MFVKALPPLASCLDGKFFPHALFVLSPRLLELRSEDGEPDDIYMAAVAVLLSLQNCLYLKAAALGEANAPLIWRERLPDKLVQVELMKEILAQDHDSIRTVSFTPLNGLADENAELGRAIGPMHAMRADVPDVPRALLVHRDRKREVALPLAREKLFLFALGYRQIACQPLADVRIVDPPPAWSEICFLAERPQADHSAFQERGLHECLPW